MIPLISGIVILAVCLKAFFLKRENDSLRSARRNQRGDDLCWEGAEAAAKALPEGEFLESCRRYRNQIAGERGEATGCLTIAQLEARIAELEQTWMSKPN